MSKSTNDTEKYLKQMLYRYLFRLAITLENAIKVTFIILNAIYIFLSHIRVA